MYILKNLHTPVAGVCIFFSKKYTHAVMPYADHPSVLQVCRKTVKHTYTQTHTQAQAQAQTQTQTQTQTHRHRHRHTQHTHTHPHLCVANGHSFHMDIHIVCVCDRR